MVASEVTLIQEGKEVQRPAELELTSIVAETAVLVFNMMMEIKGQMIEQVVAPVAVQLEEIMMDIREEVAPIKHTSTRQAFGPFNESTRVIQP